MGKNRNLCLAVAIITIFFVGLYAIQFLSPAPPETLPVNPPPIGFLDYYEHQNDRTIEATDQLASIGNTLFYHVFSTVGHSVCLYGNFTSDLGVEILITDIVGYLEYTSTGDTDSWRYRTRNTLQDDWDIILNPILDGRSVDTWYIIVSAFGYNWWEYDRHVSYYFCQDNTFPYVSLNVPPVVTGDVTFHLTTWDLHCDITSVRLAIDGSEIYSENPDTRSHIDDVIWDTRAYVNGTYDVSLYVRDSVGNSYTYFWTTVVNNTSPEVQQQVQIRQTLKGIGVGSGFLATIVVTRPRIRKKAGSTTFVVIFAILTITTTIITTPEEPELWTFFDSLSVIGSVCGITSLIYAVGKDIIKRLRNRLPKHKGEPYYIG